MTKARKPRHKDLHRIPPPNTVPRNYPCSCQCHDGVKLFEVLPCCRYINKVRADWPADADRSVLFAK